MHITCIKYGGRGWTMPKFQDGFSMLGKSWVLENTLHVFQRKELRSEGENILPMEFWLPVHGDLPDVHPVLQP